MWGGPGNHSETGPGLRDSVHSATRGRERECAGRSGVWFPGRVPATTAARTAVSSLCQERPRVPGELLPRLLLWPFSGVARGREGDQGPGLGTAVKEGPQKLSHFSSACVPTGGPGTSHTATLWAREAGNPCLTPGRCSPPSWEWGLLVVGGPRIWGKATNHFRPGGQEGDRGAPSRLNVRAVAAQP